MEWFGRRYGAPYEADSALVDTPVGELCGWCDEPIGIEESGFIIPLMGQTVKQVPYHYACQMRSILGGINHQRGMCQCCGGTEPPDVPGTTKREAADMALNYSLLRKRLGWSAR